MLECDLAGALDSALAALLAPDSRLPTGSRPGAAAPRKLVARRELERLLESSLRRDETLAAAWRRAERGADPNSVRRLTEALLRHAADDEPLREGLRAWLRRQDHPPPGEAASHANAVGGAAHVSGPVVQARDVQGGIHLHAPAPAPVPVPPPRPVPRQLPPVSAHFVGRDEDLAGLDRLRAAHPPSLPQTVVIWGPAGVGKSTLAARWLGGRADGGDFPDGQVFADLGGYPSSGTSAGPVGPGEVLERFLRALGVSDLPAETAERAALWRTISADLRLAVFLDNAFTAAQVRPLLPGGAGGLVLVTSRRQLTGLVIDGAALHQLGVLDPAAAVELLDRGGGGSRVAREAEAARDVVTLCACLPLAVCLAAAQLAARPRQPVSAMAEALTHGQGPLDSLRVEGEAAIRRALDDSYELLPGDAATLYRRVGLLPVTRYDRDMVAAACALPTPEEAEHRLGALRETSLLDDLGPDGYRFHDLVRPHARQLAERRDSEAARTATMRRFVEWCLATATAAEEVLAPSHRTLARDYTAAPPVTPVSFGDDGATALAWLDAHRGTLMAAVRHAAEAGWHAACWQLVDAMWPLFLRLRPAELWVEAHGLGLAAARCAHERAGVGRMLTSGGDGLRNARRHDEAISWYEEALRHAAHDGDLRQQAQSLQGMGSAHLLAGRLGQAEECLRRALALRQAIGYERGAALTRLSLGEVALARRDHVSAGPHLAAAHRGLVAVGDAYDAARAMAHLGRATALGGDPEGGARHLREALAAFESAGSRHWQGRTLEMLGETARHRGVHGEARQWYERARALYVSLSPRDAGRLAALLREL